MLYVPICPDKSVLCGLFASPLLNVPEEKAGKCVLSLPRKTSSRRTPLFMGLQTKTVGAIAPFCFS